jgi:hypothetical protein
VRECHENISIERGVEEVDCDEPEDVDDGLPIASERRDNKSYPTNK